MRCEDLVSLINDYLDGEMEPAFRTAFERHIRDCESCHAFFETYRKTKALTGELATHEIPAEVRDKIRKFLKKHI